MTTTLTPTTIITDPRQRAGVLITVSLALMMVVSGVSGLNVALPELAADTGATQTDIQWIVDSYTVTLAGLLYISGAIGDRFGRKYLLVAGLIIFGGAAAAAFLTSDPTTLIVIRAIMGVGAAAVMPTTLSIITSSFPEEKRGSAVGLWVGVAGAGAVLGLVMSGLLLEWFSWSSFFGLNVALAALALIGALVLVPNSVDEHPPALDVVGGLLSLIFVAGLVFGIIEGPVEGWTSPRTSVALGLGFLAGVIFVWWEARQREPLLDPRLFRLRGFSTGSASNTVQFFAAFGFFFVAMQYLQFVIGWSPLQAALGMLPMAVVLIPLARNAPHISKSFGYNRVGSSGLFLMAVGFGVLSLITVDLRYWLFVIGLILFGAGMALAGSPATTAITESLPAAKQGVASATNDTSREFGSALGIAILGSVLNNVYRSDVSAATASLPPEAAEAAESSVAAAQQLGVAAGPQGAELVASANDAFVSGATASLWTGAGVLILAAIFVFVRAPRKR